MPCTKFLLLSLIVLVATQRPIEAVDYFAYDRSHSPGNSRFKNEIGLPYTLQTLRSASEFVREFFDDDGDIIEGKDYDEVIATVEEFAGGNPPVSASTAGSSIRLNSNYIQTYSGKVGTYTWSIQYSRIYLDMLAILCLLM